MNLKDVDDNGDVNLGISSQNSKCFWVLEIEVVNYKQLINILKLKSIDKLCKIIPAMKSLPNNHNW